MRNLLKYLKNWHLAIVCIILSFFVLLQFFASLTYTDDLAQNSFLLMSDSDAMWIYQFCRELLQKPDILLDWNLGTNFWLFPNIIVNSLLIPFVQNNSLLVLLWAFILFFSIVILFSLLINSLFKCNKWIAISVTSLLLSIFLINGTTSSYFLGTTFYLLLPYHTTAFINALLCLYIAISFLKKEKLWKGIVLFVITYVSSLSNGIFLFYSVAIIVITGLVQIIIDKNNKKRFFVIVVLTLIAGLLGYYTTQYINEHFIHAQLQVKDYSFESVQSSFRFMAKMYVEIFRQYNIETIILLMSIGSFILTFYAFLKIKKQTILSFFILFVLLFSVIIFILPALTGQFFNIYRIRYNSPVLYLLIIHIAFLSLYYLQESVWLQKNAKFLFMLLFSFIFILFLLKLPKANPLKAYEKIKNNYPSVVRFADSLHKTLHLKNGVAEYWDAQYTTSFSKQKLNITSVFDGLEPYHWASSRNAILWEDLYKKRRKYYNFVIANGIKDTTLLYKKFPKGTVKKITSGKNVAYLVPEFYYDEYVFDVRLKEK